MRTLFVLLKKDFLCAISAFRQKGRRRDLAGWISTTVLMLGIFAVFIYFYDKFAQNYRTIVFGSPAAEADRVYELITYAIGAVLLLQIVIGVRKIYLSLTDVSDYHVLISQPIRLHSMYLYKLLRIYLTQLFSALLILLPVAVVTDVLSAYAGGAVYYLVTVAAVLLTTAIACAIAALLAVPYTLVMRFLETKYILRLVIYICLIGAAFWVYGRILTVVTSLLNSGELAFVYELDTMEQIHRIAQYFYPASLLSDAVFGRNIALNLVIVVFGAAAAGALSYFVIRGLYISTIQQRLEGEWHVFRKRTKVRRCSPIGALLRKELIVVLRTPSYAFQYLATSLTVPLLVYQCVSLMRVMMSTITILDCDYELAVFAVALFSIVGNSFCTTNFSRDGKMAMMLKTLPVRIKDVIGAKLIFCGAVSAFSVFLISVILLSTGILSVVETIALFFIGLIVSSAEIAAATRKDLNSPVFPTQDKDEVTDSNSNVSAIMLLGLLFAFLAGAGSVVIGTYVNLAQMQTSPFLLSTLFILAVTGIACAWSFFYLFHGLQSGYDKMEG